MTKIVGRTSFNRPVEDLFDFLADPRNEPLYNPVVLSAEKTTPGPVGVGTRFVQRLDRSDGLGTSTSKWSRTPGPIISGSPSGRQA